MPNSPITFDNVEVVRTTDLGMWCRVDGQDVFVGSTIAMSGTTVRIQGDWGRLVAPRWFVRASGLRETLEMSRPWPTQSAVDALSPDERAEISDVLACFGLVVDDPATLLRLHRALERVRTRARLSS